MADAKSASSPSHSLELLSSSSMEVVVAAATTVFDCTNSLTTNRLSFHRY